MHIMNTFALSSLVFVKLKVIMLEIMLNPLVAIFNVMVKIDEAGSGDTITLSFKELLTFVELVILKLMRFKVAC